MIDVNLPASWATTTIQNAISSGGLISDGDWVESKDQDPAGTVRLIQLADIGDGEFKNKSDRFMNEASATALNCTYIETGDLLIARMPDPLGRACLFPGVGQKCVTVVDVCLIRTSSKSGISNKLLTYWINSPEMRELIAENSSGTTRKRITRKKLEQFYIPLPPLAEQKIIADKLDTLLAQVESTKARLDRIPDILKRFRQSVLADAVSGKLTERWREDKGIIWQWLTIDEIGEVRGGKRLPKGDELVENNTGFPYIRAGQLKLGTVIKTDDARSKQLFLKPETQQKIKRYTVNSGDLYLTIVGASIGDAGIIPEHYSRANLTENAAKITDFKRPIRSQFLSYWLRSQELQDLIKLEIKSGAQGKLALKRIKELPAPYTDIREQIEIVRRVEELFTYADKIEQKANAALARVNNLTQSILAKAFRGKLTAQWRAENPELISAENSAAALLAKIKAERAKISQESKTRKRKASK